MDIRELYKEKAQEFAKLYGVNASEHIIQIMVSIMATRDKTSYQGGSFVTSVVNNDLFGAVSRADSECRDNLYILTMCNANCFLK
jgi:hypothetical protein